MNIHPGWDYLLFIDNNYSVYLIWLHLIYTQFGTRKMGGGDFVPDIVGIFTRLGEFHCFGFHFSKKTGMIHSTNGYKSGNIVGVIPPVRTCFGHVTLSCKFFDIGFLI